MKGGDGRVGQAQVHLLGPVPGDGFVGADGVVLDPVLLGSVGESDGVGDLVEKGRSYFKVPKPRSRDPCDARLNKSPNRALRSRDP